MAQVLYHLNYTYSCFALFYCFYFILPRASLGLYCDPPMYISNVAEILDMYNHTQLLFWDRVSLAFLLWAGLKSHSFCLYFLSSWDCR
jgi:hypothetical protein